MKRFSYWPYLFLLLFYFCVFSAPPRMTEQMRSAAVCSFSPGWRALNFCKEKVLVLLTLPVASATKKDPDLLAENERLQQENQLMQSQIEQVREWLLMDDLVQEQQERLKALSRVEDPSSAAFFERRGKELCRRLELHVQSLTARVIFREPSSWSSSLWIDVGEKHNTSLGKKLIAKNSPVLFGTSIIGVVEYVGNSRSRVRLITDSSLALSVRALRGREQDRFLHEHVDSLLFALELRQDLFATVDEAESTLKQLSHLKHQLTTQGEDLYLAKGELCGSSAPLWRSRGQYLKGIGFNYDFSDEEGPARDLRTGLPYDPLWKKDPMCLLRVGDILVTTGFDGIFPAGFRVATVSKVQMLKEGASSYEIEALPTAGNLDDLSYVVVLPSLDPDV